ncbi:rho-related GTP-binding protein RhoF isoform X3 [Erinaceus europaeus]|uniref:Rho-related GTP-binding protein RhoF isoform X3 n=1 Tax=Erinaceus europaeus TaxID=9365 RepID=A0ABM3XJY6_ERIEU|nr:rho-related GTP-binding protein RhoF isoform X3 [Erinaceus europaeus]
MAKAVNSPQRSRLSPTRSWKVCRSGRRRKCHESVTYKRVLAGEGAAGLPCPAPSPGVDSPLDGRSRPSLTVFPPKPVLPGRAMDAPAPAVPGPGRKELKIVIVGDGGCGKTSLLMVYCQGSFPEHYAPSVFEKYTASVMVGSKEVTLNLYDTAGQEDYDRLRPLSYQNTHVVLICYDVMNPTSYDNVLVKWVPEVTHFCRGTPTVLIGCKTDLRKDKEQLRKLRAAQQEPITYMQGLSTCEQIQAALYLECSAKFRENVEDVFREAAKVALSALKKAQRGKKRRLCLLL